MGLALLLDYNLCFYQVLMPVGSSPYLPNVELLCNNSEFKGVIVIKVNIYSLWA